jgi:hypothetical protein
MQVKFYLLLETFGIPDFTGARPIYLFNSLLERYSKPFRQSAMLSEEYDQIAGNPPGWMAQLTGMPRKTFHFIKESTGENYEKTGVILVGWHGDEPA